MASATPFAVGTPFGASPPVIGSSIPILTAMLPAAALAGAAALALAAALAAALPRRWRRGARGRGRAAATCGYDDCRDGNDCTHAGDFHERLLLFPPLCARGCRPR